jgi:hypothetical protein
MKKINAMNEYWIVKDRRTGKVLCHCADINDAIMMVNFDSNNRFYTRHRFIMDQVIDITSTTDKHLPGQIGLPSGKINRITQEVIRLNEAEGEPVII